MGSHFIIHNRYFKWKLCCEYRENPQLGSLQILVRTSDEQSASIYFSDRLDILFNLTNRCNMSLKRGEPKNKEVSSSITHHSIFLCLKKKTNISSGLNQACGEHDL